MTTIHPTHHCFDDALDFLAERLKREPHLVDADVLVLAHGIALAPEGEHAGRPFAHAWVEENGGLAWQAGVLEGEKIYFAVQVEELVRDLRIQEATRYTPRQARQENRRSGHFGPWVEAYRALCANGDRTVFAPEPSGESGKVSSG